MAAITENVIRTVIEIIGRGDERTSARITRIHDQLTKLQGIEAVRGRSFTGMRSELGKYVRKTEDLTRVQGRIRQHGEKMQGLSGREERALAHTTIQTGKYQKELMQTVVAKKKFREEMTRLQRRAKAFPRDIRALSAQQSLLNRAQQQGTITMATYKRKIEPINKEMEKLEGKTGRNIAAMAKWALGWFILYRMIRLVMGGITSSIRTFADLENEMARVSTVTRLMGETKQKTMDTLREAVLKYGATSIRSFKEIAEAMYHLGSAGMNVTQQLQGFEHILNLTTGTMGNIRQVSRLVAGSFNLYGHRLEHLTGDSEKFKYISDLLAYTYSIQQVELSEIANAMTLVGAAGSLLNIDYKVLIGTIGELNTGMLRGTRAGTSLMNSFIKIAQNSEKLGRILGVTFDPEMPLDYVDVMTQLHKRFGDSALSVDNLRKLMQVFGIRGARAVGEILNRFDKWKETVEVTDATFQDFARHMTEQIQDTLPRQLKILGNVIYKEIVERLKPVADPLKWFIQSLHKRIELGKEIGELAEHYGESEELIVGLDKEIIKQLYERARLGERIAEKADDRWKIARGMTPEEHALLRAKIEGLTTETETEKKMKGQVGLADDLLTIEKKLNKERKKEEREKRVKELIEAEKARVYNLAKIEEYRTRAIRLQDLELTGHADYLIANEKILEYYHKQLGERKQIISDQEILNGLTEKEKRLLNKQMISWETIRRIVVDLTKRDLPKYKKAIIGLENPIRDMMEALIAGTKEWGDIAGDIIRSIGNYLEAQLTESLQKIKLPALLVGPIGAIAGGIFAGLAGLITGAGKEQEKIREATLDVSAGIDISNEQLAVINRNLLDIRHAMEGYPMPSSYYFRQRPGTGVQIQRGGIVINMPEGSDGEDVVKAIEESFGLAGSRVYQPS